MSNETSNTRDCPGCQQPFDGEGYDPGCNYGCGFFRAKAPDCHGGPYCTESCFDNANERAAEREYEDFHSGGGPLSLDEQCRRAREVS